MTVETKDLKGIKNLNLVYLLNALGEDTGIAPIPENVMSWYNETVLDNEWLSYLVKKEDTYGLLYLLEIAHNEADNFKEDKERFSEEWINASPQKIWSHIEEVAGEINELVDYEVIIGKESGIFARHELCIFFPYGTEKNTTENQFQKIKDINILF